MQVEVKPVLSDSKVAKVFSPSNIALAKYWGKRDVALNLPTNSSVSATLKDFGSFTTVEFNSSFSSDEVYLNRQLLAASATTKIKRVLDLIRGYAQYDGGARVQSVNNFPTAAGLASSASGLSALTLAAAKALQLDLNLTKLSEIARQGSGSACRSLFAGFVKWQRGEIADGSDSVANSIAAANFWPFKIIIAITNAHSKANASTNAMQATKETSPYFEAWVKNAHWQAQQIEQAILQKDFSLLAELAETNCIRMHASAMAANPPILYWNQQTIQVLTEVQALRKKGLAAFFTIDAGPNVVVFALPQDFEKIYNHLTSIANLDLLVTEIGEGAKSIL